MRSAADTIGAAPGGEGNDQANGSAGIGLGACQIDESKSLVGFLRHREQRWSISAETPAPDRKARTALKLASTFADVIGANGTSVRYFASTLAQSRSRHAAPLGTRTVFDTVLPLVVSMLTVAPCR